MRVQRLLTYPRGGWHLDFTSGAEMDAAGLNEANWRRLAGEPVRVISPSSRRTIYAEPYCVGDTRFVGTEVTPGVYAIYSPSRPAQRKWLEGLPLADS